MYFTSTRSRRNVTSAQAIARGLAEDGGLFIPNEFPKISEELIDRMTGMDYKARAREVLALYLTDFTAEEIAGSVEAAYTGTFDRENPAPLVEIAPGLNILELWHGPTCAFKDMALQLLPHLLTISARKAAPGRTMVIPGKPLRDARWSFSQRPPATQARPRSTASPMCPAQRSSSFIRKTA